ncbi:MAG TPA: acetate/propionate family kinase [Steroidobacteraceae bacterium]|nr:acetate/propionate family kinase [Steroidobacteraceae bacterium]
MSATHSILTINGGSSTLRFALFDASETPRLLLRGKIERIGFEGARWTVNRPDGTQEGRGIVAANHAAAATYLLNWLESEPAFSTVLAVAHRVVHGMAHSTPERVTRELLGDLRRIMAFDPEHLPFEIDLIAAIGQRHPALLQVACFDTAFHRTMPKVARSLPIPRRYQSMGVERYGFHGLSCAFLMQELERLGDPAARSGLAILAHLGNGASLTAVRDGRSVDTSMGFTPASGTMMSTRSGDLDPGLSHYLAQTQQMDTASFQHMVNHASGLLGVSEISSDMRDLLALEKTDERAAEAIALYCYQAKKWIGALAAALGGVDTLVFAGGIGENAPLIRERICSGLGFLDIELDGARNAESAALISATNARVRVRVIRTDEELVLARSALPFCSRPE